MKVLQFTSSISFPATFPFLFYHQLTAELPDKNEEVLARVFDFLTLHNVTLTIQQ